MSMEPPAEKTRHALCDHDAFAGFVRQHAPRVLAFCRERVPDRQTAEDATQEAFLRFYSQITAGRAPQKPLGWLLAIARNCCQEMQRSLAKHKSIDPADVHCTQQAPSVPEAPVFNELIEGLSEMDQALLRLKHVDGLRCREIAEQTNKPLGSVTSSLSRIYKTLRAVVTAEEHS